MIRIAPPLAVIAALAACSAPARAPDPATNSTVDAAPPASTAPARPATAEASGAANAYAGAGGLVRLRYADPLRPAQDFAGKALMAAGWRLMWDGKDAGPGTGVVSFAEDARPASGGGDVIELLRIGMSRDAGVVASCGTAGLQGPNTRRLPNRTMGGHRWTVWRNGDAGMSQQIDATDYRTVVNGVCYAIDRASYYVRASAPKPGLPAQRAAAARIDAVLASVHVGG